MNPRLAEILGFTPEEMHGLRVLDLVAEADRDMVTENTRKRVSGEVLQIRYIFRALRKDGSEVPMEVHGSTTPHLGRVAIIATLLDITERKQGEEERWKGQTLKSIGTLAGGIAHDFNNVLQSVFGYVSLAKAAVEPHGETWQTLAEAEAGLETATRLTGQLLTFAEGGKPIRKTIPIGPIVEDAVGSALRGARSRSVLRIEDGLWSVHGDRAQLAQVVHGIALNACQAMTGDGTLTVTAGNRELGDENRPREVAPGRYVVIGLEDTGGGIAPEVLPRIFDPFFTTGKQGSAQGMGLAIAHSIVRSHGGSIDVTSRPGQGSTFHVYLPASGAERPAPPPKVSAPASSPGRGRVLVMDDEDRVRDAVGRLLGLAGWNAETAADGEEALAKYQQAMSEGRRFDLVILDLTVKGGMGGEEAIKRLAEIDPAVVGIVSSGYSDDEVLTNYAAHGFRAVLPKPYSKDALEAVLHACSTRPSADG